MVPLSRSWQDLDKASKEHAMDLGKGTITPNLGYRNYLGIKLQFGKFSKTSSLPKIIPSSSRRGHGAAPSVRPAAPRRRGGAVVPVLREGVLHELQCPRLPPRHRVADPGQEVRLDTLHPLLHRRLLLPGNNNHTPARLPSKKKCPTIAVTFFLQTTDLTERSTFNRNY